ncbi:MAG: hypothetical protein V1904_04420 [Bacteroidota bacterium]
MNDFWKEKVKNLVQENKFLIKYIDSTVSGNISNRILLLTDTNSTRGILVKMLLKGGVFYTLKANIDTINGASLFVKTFFDNFIPADTFIGTDICSDKINELWFSQLYSTDTTVRKKVNKSLSYALMNMKDEHVPQLIKIIQDTIFMHFTLSEKSSIIKTLGYLKSKEITSFLKKMYLTYTDSVSIQFAILDAIAMQQNEQAIECILELLNNNVIVSSTIYDITQLFDYFDDSLKLARSLFPDILKFAKYEEYRKPVYNLLSDLIEQGFLNKKGYISFKNEIIRDARYDLNKLISTKEKKSTYTSYDYYSYSNYSKFYYTNPTDNLKESEKVFYHYSVIMRSFYCDEIQNTILEKIITSGSDELAIAILTHYMKYDIEINDTLFRHYASDPETVSILHRYLTYNKITDMINNAFFPREKLIISELFKDKFDLKKDSVVLLAKKYVNSKESNGYVYFFKACRHGKDIWSLGYSGIHPEENNKTKYDTDISSTSFKFETEKQMNDEIANIMKKVRCLGHKRVKTDDYYYYDYY